MNVFETSIDIHAEQELCDRKRMEMNKSRLSCKTDRDSIMECLASLAPTGSVMVDLRLMRYSMIFL